MGRKLDLRSGRPVWFAYRAPPVRVGKLTRDVKSEVLVVGMGISGAMMAEALTRAGHEVMCIDRRGPVLGSTSATTALVQFELDQPLVKLSAIKGKLDAARAWRRSRLAVINLRGRIAELGIDCTLADPPSLYLAGNMLGPAELRTESNARRQAGIAATYLTRQALADSFGIDRAAAILSHDNIALDPRKLTAGLLLRALGRKARLYAPVQATEIEHGRDQVVVKTSLGPTISARHLVLATGYELTDIIPATAHSIVSTWAIATNRQPQGLWPATALLWEASEPYLYVRTTADGRVICGGEDEDFTDEEHRDAMIAEKAQRLAAKLGHLLPKLDTRPEFAWTGSFGTTTSGLPYIGALPRFPRIHAVMGYGGNGITFSQIASEMVSSAIGGLQDIDSELFAFRGC
ncbi:MAG: FAD-binding oxidoreductase [Mesorhizobium sp.]|uniref:NAD(P)/FAD-dependent oxidoreductase n=1 Tax=unclassified Mesorhizobium TaxID=325217 RepID=UPI000FCB12FA|nr:MULTISPECIES: FAD-binding oxidoreductase [unclassified Mesorhizobium]RUX52850.1 FAD-binding oxidoreductase [Mesorhizobium sp. M4A.F.Ca.ET.050.02.1.1]RVD39306.1 FAD-binding oxidoreductase [Mesorhizobium sp. M4A.F.Ca.ET.020.02.1.1]RWC20187.1 MAG: FAD-binding oxidoreductase [Mesorhizobium sp.]RWD04627.1 MAG: FAD-binding oxidoreductase [Mesorhizobium sp.]RWD30026.1 MAG: FAD-binding oxidoreductase [Mesorhizobium sp.]